MYGTVCGRGLGNLLERCVHSGVGHALRQVCWDLGRNQMQARPKSAPKIHARRVCRNRNPKATKFKMWCRLLCWAGWAHNPNATKLRLVATGTGVATTSTVGTTALYFSLRRESGQKLHGFVLSLHTRWISLRLLCFMGHRGEGSRGGRRRVVGERPKNLAPCYAKPRQRHCTTTLRLRARRLSLASPKAQPCEPEGSASEPEGSA